MPVHAQACGYTRNRDEQKRVQSLAASPAFLARTPQCHEPPARACLMARQCQPRQSNAIQMCKLARYRCALQPCYGSNRGMSVSADTLVQQIGQPGN